jgi:hypothetical protein
LLTSQETGELLLANREKTDRVPNDPGRSSYPLPKTFKPLRIVLGNVPSPYGEHI